LKSLSISPKGAIAGAVWLCVAAALTPLAASRAEDRAPSQFLRDRWEAEQGFPGGAVWGIAQSSDGYLWIGADKGLVRYDGLTFRLFQHSSPGSPPLTRVLGLTSDADGVVWVRLQGSRLLRCRDDRVDEVTPPVSESEVDFTAMSRGSTGAVLLAGLRTGVIAQQGASFVPLTSGITLRSVVISLAETAAGTVWIGTRDLGLFSLRDGRLSASLPGLPDSKINTLLPIGDRELWIGTDSGIARWNGSEIVTSGLPASLTGIQALTMIGDRASNVWIGTSGGVVRVDRTGAVSLDDRRRGGVAVTALFEDREGNVWTGDARGIERFRSSPFVTFNAENLPSASHGPVYVDAAHHAWLGPPDGGLYRLSGSRLERVAVDGLSADVIYSIDGDERELWIGRQRGGLTRLRNDDGRIESRIETKTYTHADGLAQNNVYGVLVARDKAVWAATLNGGVSRLKDGRFTTYTSSHGLPSNTVVSLAEGADGTMWFATPNGIASLSNGRWRRYGESEGLPSPDATVLLADPSGAVWAGTTGGLAYIDAEGVHVSPGLPVLKETILGLADDRRGSMWIATSSHVLRVGRDGLMRGSLEPADVREYGVADGLRSVEVMKRHRSVTIDSLGRVWLSTTRGLSVIDPAQVSASAPPALVLVNTVSADGNPLDMRGTVRVPAGNQRLTFEYAGLSLTVPDRVRFRYRLDPFDRAWSEPTAAREAAYTNLAHGSYTFRVIASNSQGSWNGTEATIAVVIAPVFWQTWWFRLSAVAVVALATVGLYRIRLHQMTRQLAMRFDERLAERTRIAQELHDTLLQGFVSAAMQLDVAADRLPADSPAKAPLGRVLELMRQVIDEGRNAVRGLRSPDHGSPDLAEAFSGIQDELSLGERVDYRVFVEGQPRPLHPAVRDEVYRIGREALVNAFRHAGAKAIEVELEYAAKHLRMLVRDDGRGMSPDVVQSGTDGHWGLSGMRERAERIGARFKVFSRARAGTEIELMIPAHIAFRKERDR
jgi:signal transduction histidine kinase/ligand-binding sensor domain-containing protein